MRWMVLLVCLLSVACVACTGECGGGTQVTIVNETLSTLRIDVGPVSFSDAGVSTLQLAPGESVDVVRQFSIGGGATDPNRYAASITIRDAETVVYTGAITSPPFVLTGHPDRSPCSSAVYTYTVTP